MSDSKKLNFGCGARFSPHWVNIDFDSSDSRVTRVNLLGGFPFPDSSFDVVYSSHVLEHFTPEQAAFLGSEALRVLRPGGILRTVLPDLEASCTEYLRILALPESDPTKPRLYQWAVIELLDQMVRSQPGGHMRSAIDAAMADPDPTMARYIQSRTEHIPWSPPEKPSLAGKLRKFTFAKLRSKLPAWWVKLVTLLIPKNIRSMVLIQTPMGERHRWMYDFYGFSLLLTRLGFTDIQRLDFKTSAIPDFHADLLDINADGLPYKNNSIFCEARKPPA